MYTKKMIFEIKKILNSQEIKHQLKLQVGECTYEELFQIIELMFTLWRKMTINSTTFLNKNYKGLIRKLMIEYIPDKHIFEIYFLIFGMPVTFDIGTLKKMISIYWVRILMLTRIDRNIKTDIKNITTKEIEELINKPSVILEGLDEKKIERINTFLYKRQLCVLHGCLSIGVQNIRKHRNNDIER